MKMSEGVQKVKTLWIPSFLLTISIAPTVVTQSSF